MIKNYFKIAYRNLIRYKAYTAINIIGLTLGLTCSALLLLFLKNELTYDSFHSKSNRIARVIGIDARGDEPRYVARSSMRMGPALQDYYADIVRQTRLVQPQGHIDIVWKGERISERRWIMTDTTFFDIFDFKFLEGNPKTALQHPNSIVLSQATAKKYFGDRSPLNETMEFSFFTVKVTGVIENIPSNSQLRLDMILSENTAFTNSPWWERIANAWDRYPSYTYVELVSEQSISKINNKSGEFIKNLFGEDGVGFDVMLQPLEEAYLNSEHIEFDLFEKKGSWFSVYLFSAIALFILAIACINYINLATARSMERAKEIGIRKVSGAMRNQLINQFLSESMVVSFVSFVLSVGLIDLILPAFNQLTGSTLAIDFFTLPYLGSMFLLALLVGFISGLYPAFYLSKLKPSESLKGEKAIGDSSAVLRKGLVILQFTLSIIMIVATITVSRQLEYIKNANLGFDKERMLVIDINNQHVRESFEAMKNEFSKIAGVQSVASSSRVPGEWKNIRETTIKPMQGGDSIQSFFMCFDEGMLSTFSLELIQGQNFLGKLAEDSTKVLLNETAAERLGGVEVGQNVLISDYEHPLKVAGILKDFNFQSLHSEIAPLMVGYWSNPVTVIDYFSLKIEPGVDLSEVVESSMKVHESFDDSTPMEFHFLNEQVSQFYEAEQQAGSIFTLAAGITILIACLGLFGLASFVVRKRSKEVSIRKVLGASSFQLFVLLSRTFVLQVLISSLVAAPIAWWIMDHWLNEFSYRVNITIWVFLIAGISALLVALLTTSYQSLRTALLNPADTLKNE